MAIPTLKPMDLRKTQYGIPPESLKKRAADLSGITSVLVKELFPEIPDPLYPGSDLSAIRKETKRALDTVDLSKIKPGDNLNILGSHHGFTLLGGGAYAEMLKAIKDEVKKRTGTDNIRLRVGVGLRFREAEEYIKRFELDKYFEGKAIGIAPVDQPIEIETEIGPLYGIKKAYDAKWIIHAHNSDIREVHFHRLVDRILKPFGMSYARIETRSAYHHNLGPRGANFIARAIFESPFVKEKFIASVILRASPVGILGVDADNNIYDQSDRITIEIMQHYGKLIRLLNKIEKCVAVIDCPGPIPYTFAAGLIFANFLSANVDVFDLSLPLTPYSFYSEMAYDKKGNPRFPGVPPINPAIGAVVNNYSFKGYPSTFFAEHTPTIVVGQEMARLFELCEQNPEYMSHAVIAKDLDNAMNFAKKIAKTDNVIVFDGAQGGLNVSESLREFLLEKADQVKKEVEEILMPKWLKQRGIVLEANA